MRPRALVAPLALLALAALASPAQAAPPQAQPWQVDLGSAAIAGAALALAMDEAGSQILVGTADRAGVGSADNDLARILFAEGNVTAEQDGSNLGGEGKGSVAVSADGKFAVAGGNYTGGGLSGANLFYYPLPSLAAQWTKSISTPVTTVALSGAGTVVVAGTANTSATNPGRVFRYDGSGNALWDRAVNGCGGISGTGGSVLSLDISRDGKWIVAGTAYLANDGPRGCVLLFDSANLNPVVAYNVLSVGAADVTAVDISPNGLWFGAGTSGGAFYLFHNVDGERGTPLQDQLPALSAVRDLRVAEDGGAIVVADAGTVNRYARSPGLLSLAWSAPVPGVRGLDATPDGEYVVVGAAQVRAFHRSGNATLWTLDLADALVRVAQANPNDIRIAAASGTQVRGYRLHWALDVRKSEPDQPPIPVALGQARPYTLEVINAGSAHDRFELSVAPSGFTVDLQPPALELRPGEAVNVTLTMTPGPQAEARVFRLELVARGVRSGVEAIIPVNVTVGAVPRLGIAVVDPSYRDRAVFQGESHAIVLEVQNAGNARLEVAYDLTQQPNVGPPWEATLSRTSGSIEPRGVTSNTLTLLVPFEAFNGTENLFNVTVRGEGAQASATFRLVVNPIVTGAIQVIPQSKLVAPGKSTVYSVIVANNGTLREEYRLIYCVALPDLIPCLGNATLGLGGWSVALDTSPFTLDHDQSRSFQMAVAAPRGAIPNVDKLVLQLEVIATNPEHVFRDTRLVLTTVVEEGVEPTRPPITPGFEAVFVLAALGAALLLRRR